MGRVLSAIDEASGRALAIKRIKPAQRASAQVRAAFEHEYRALRSLRHPRIIEVYDYGVDQEGPYYTMELLAGQDLRAAARLPWRRACAVIRDLATSLALLHTRRLLYRDLSPSNVRLTENGRAKLLDFGALANFGYAEDVMGTPPMIPPEALYGSMLDGRVDLYALGALLYYCLTGRHAYAARCIEELQAAWTRPPTPPSRIVAGVPEELDVLVRDLLNEDPLVRPSSAADVFVRLSAIAGLPPEQEDEAAILAQSFLTNPRFVGREPLITTLDESISELRAARGGALRIEAAAGCGRTRVLEEAGVRAQLAGASVLRVDAGADGSLGGVVRALANCLLTALPALARIRARPFWYSLEPLGLEVWAKLRSEAPMAEPAAERMEVSIATRRWLVSVSEERPLLLAIDNLEHADDASLGFLVELAREAPRHALLLLMTERRAPAGARRVGHATLASCSALGVVDNLNQLEVRELSRTLFGEVPNLTRFSEWLYAASAGNPLHYLEMVKQLLARGSIRYAGGAFTLPDGRPDVRGAFALQDALLARTESLSDDALALAQCLALQRAAASRALCSGLFEGVHDDAGVRGLLDELSQRDILLQQGDGFRFSTMAMREALLEQMDGYRRRLNHRRLGAALMRLAKSGDHMLRIQAGHHLLRGGEETRGADMLAREMANSVVMRTLSANLHQLASIAEEGLRVYERERRSLYERLPFLSLLTAAGFYEDHRWGQRYGDAALDALEHISGLGLARRLAPLLGKRLSVIVGVLLAALRFWLVPRQERVYPFREVLAQLFSGVTNLMAVAAQSLDGARADRIAQLLEPFSTLPERLTPVGVYQFVRALRFITREEQAQAHAAYQELERRFSDRRYYATLPDDVRPLYLNACRYAGASFAVFRNDGRSALVAADALDASNLRLYRMIAAQIRYLYYAYRGELSEAARHREEVEIHAAHVGSAAQVEVWEPAALLPLYFMLDDMVNLTRLTHRLESLRTSFPSLSVYAELGAAALALGRDGDAYTALAHYEAVVEGRAPRSMFGWAVAKSMIARAHNARGEHARAADVCQEVLQHMTPADRDYVVFFLYVELQMAEAELGLGHVQAALDRLDALLARHTPSQHPLALGLIWARRAEVGLRTGDGELVDSSLAEMERWFVATGTPALIAQYERLRDRAATRGAALPNTWRPAPLAERRETEALLFACDGEPDTAAVLRPAQSTSAKA